jgi:phosphatidylserine decarboxylase
VVLMLDYGILIVFVTLGVLSLGRKWELKPAHYVPWLLLMVILSCLTVYALTQRYPSIPVWLLIFIGLVQTGILSALTILFFFYRDPERTPPAGECTVLSPADGTVVYVKQIENGQFPFAVKGQNTIPLKEFADTDLISDTGYQIGIAMNFLNVHVNRSPIGGEVEMVKRIPGKFASLKHISSLLENERVLMVTRGDGIRVGIVQIASRLVRRIVPYIHEGQTVEIGQRVGMIRFGSQVDVLIPALNGLKIVVNEKQQLKAGESIIATYAKQQ